MPDISTKSSSQSGQLPKEALNEKSGQGSGIAVDQELLDALEKPREIYKVVQEGLFLAGGAAAILLQVANPGVAKGVNEHSYYEQRPLDRLRTTMIYVYCMVYGTRQEKEAVITMVNKVHARESRVRIIRQMIQICRHGLLPLYMRLEPTYINVFLATLTKQRLKGSTGNMRFLLCLCEFPLNCGPRQEKISGHTGTRNAKPFKSPTTPETSREASSTTRTYHSGFELSFLLLVS